MEWTVDAHCHWSDARFFAKAEIEIPRVIEAGIAGFLLGGVDPAEWSRQSELKNKFPDRFWRAFGLHPYFVAQNPAQELDAAWKILEQQAAHLEAIGETGLDFRKQFLSSGKEKQIEWMQKHLALAKQQDKPLILHIVRAHEEALHELKTSNNRGMIHAFTAGPRVAKRYLDLGYHLSVGAKLLHPETHDLADTVKAIPLEFLLIESDCPDQPPPGQTEHDSSTVWAIVDRVAELKKLARTRVVEETRANLFKLIGKEFQA